MTRQEAIERFKHIIAEFYKYDIPKEDQQEYYMAIASLEAWDELKAEIAERKAFQSSPNQDYYTGYMSAMSTVEGMIAGYELEMNGGGAENHGN